MPRIVIIADDLTGAADCAASSAALGYKVEMLLHSQDDQKPEEDWPDADILSIDGNTRCLSIDRASEVTARLARQWDARSAVCPGHFLYKKIDSTLRGNVASELLALLKARRAFMPEGSKLSILMAPASPAQGRTTVGGRLLVRGVSLEETDIWQAERRTPQSDIRRLIAEAGLSSELIDLKSVRSNPASLRDAIQQAAQQCDVVVCDAETDSDLRAIAEQSVKIPIITAFAGSAGLARQIPLAIGMVAEPDCHEWRFAEGPTLFVVGTSSPVSREQARLLEQIPEVATVRASPMRRHELPELQIQITHALQSGRDVLLTLNDGECATDYEDHKLQEMLSQVAAKCALLLGGVVATGGSTARAVLDAFGIDRLRLLGEVEPGIPFSVADRWLRPLPVITKAGAFGSSQALILCREFLVKLERGVSIQAASSPHDH